MYKHRPEGSEIHLVAPDESRWTFTQGLVHRTYLWLHLGPAVHEIFITYPRLYCISADIGIKLNICDVWYTQPPTMYTSAYWPAPSVSSASSLQSTPLYCVAVVSKH